MELQEIKYTILEKLHPYYGLSLYMTNKDTVSCGNYYKYQILKSWVLPTLSNCEIKKMLPNISYTDVVELALFYVPIPDSIGKFDNYSLCYNCFVQEYEDPLFMFDPKDEVDTEIIYSLCYAFDRLDVITNMKDRFKEPWCFDGSQREQRREIYQLMCDLISKRRGKQIEIVCYKQICDHVLNGNMFMCHLPYLLTKNQLLEFLVLMCLTRIDLYDLLLAGVEDYENWNPNYTLIDELLGSYDQDTIDNIILKYCSRTIFPPIPRRVPRASTIWEKELKAPFTNFDYHLHPELITQMTKDTQMLYYLTSGKYIDYVRLRNEGIKLLRMTDFWESITLDHLPLI